MYVTPVPMVAKSGTYCKTLVMCQILHGLQVMSGVTPGETVNIGISDSVITFTINGAPMTVPVLDSNVTFSPTSMETFGLSGSSWAATAPTTDALNKKEVSRTSGVRFQLRRSTPWGTRIA